MYVKYDSNNSGGHWWLEDRDWKRLEQAGWKVEWAHLGVIYNDDGSAIRDEDGTPKLVPLGTGNNKWTTGFRKQEKDGSFRFLGALAQRAYRVGLPLRDAVMEWELITGKSSTDAGCPCCGQPHNFKEYDDDGKCVASGPTTSYEASW